MCVNIEERNKILRIWKIDHNALHDGPGIRTTFFLKGCALRCAWCANPEGQTYTPTVTFKLNRCKRCGQCVRACPYGAIQMSLKDNVQLYPTVDRRQCVSCGICKNSCDQRAIDLLGKDYTHDEILRIAERDQSLHRRTGGGITLTGGEPLNQGESLIELISRCRAAGIHTALETCAFAPYELFEAAIKEVQLLFIDLKHMDSIWHKELTGQSNSIILSNLKSASHFACLYKFVLIVRLVLVPGINDGDNLIAAGRFLAKLPHLDGVEILKYHNFGAFKYELFGEQYKMKHVILPTDEDIAYAKELLSSFGFRML